MFYFRLFVFFVKGVTRSYIEEFKEFRTVRLEGYSDETNKIIIRLDRLLTNIPTDLAKKKSMFSLVQHL